MKRKIDDLGRLVIPMEIRKELKINNGDSVNIEVVDNKVVVTNTNEINYKEIVEEIKDYVNRCYLTIDGEKVVYKEDIEELIEEFENGSNA